MGVTRGLQLRARMPLRRCTPSASALVGACILALAGCSSTAVHLKADDIPATPTTLPARVNVCGLLTRQEVASVVGQPVRIVGASLLAPRVPTYECQWGKEFAVPLVTVDLGADAVSPSVFTSAYGPRLGGDPVTIHRLGDSAYFRVGKDAYTMNVHLPSAVLTLSVDRTSTTTIPQQTVADLARAAAGRLPENPRLIVPAMRAPCSTVPVVRIAAVVAQPPVARTSFSGPDGSTICTWSSRPGLVRVILHRDAAYASQLQRDINPSDSEDVDLGENGWKALSRTDVAGDLLAFGPHHAVVEISVTPTSGWASSSIPATGAEVALAKSVIKAVG
jgi:hypothetical protein